QGAVLSTAKIASLSTSGRFGRSLAYLGTVNGHRLLAIGAPEASGTNASSGVVWILELDSAGAVVPGSARRISNAENGFPSGLLHDGDQFGYALANAGDWDGDGVPELIVGARWDDDGGTNRGAIYILYLNSNWTVRQAVKISNTAGGLGAPLADSN